MAPALPALYEHGDHSLVLALVRSHLVNALPLYSTLRTPGYPVHVWATFAAFDAAGQPVLGTEDDGLWLVLADLGNQLRFFCSYASHDKLSAEQRARGEELVVGALRRYLLEHHNGRDRISIGAVPDIWTSCISRNLGECFSASTIHWILLDKLPPVAANGATVGASVLPGGVVVTEGREEDITEILSTSEVPHPPAYLATRLPYTTVLRQPSATPSASSAGPLASTPPTVLAHCTTHRDGSVGTLHVSPAHRQRSLGSQVLLARLHAMASTRPCHEDDGDRNPGAGGYGFCYVHKENEPSRRLMQRVGMSEQEGEVWWCRVKLPIEELT
ncbi:uncharacterized protein JCM10292_000490 [Rhodotorula paludigena]|uniref:uncharacterized protein n=1 Tax=Rhodotorula paludigena TaxID=86838 RepID=UPI003178FE22